MHDRLTTPDLLTQLAQRARRESAPQVNVVAHVMAEIRNHSDGPAQSQTPWWWTMAGISGALATAAAIFAAQTLAAWQDPLNQWFGSFDRVMR